MTTAVLHAEWLKIRTLRSAVCALLAVPVATAGMTILVNALTSSGDGADTASPDRLFTAFFGISFGQIAAMAFGTLAFSTEFHNGALRTSLSAVPDRTRFYAAKTAVVAASVLLIGLVTGFATFLGGQAVVDGDRMDLADPGALRACLGAGIYLSLVALLAAGFTALLRSGTAVLSLLIPFVLIVSFVIGDVSGGAAGYLPDKAGQQVLRQDTTGGLEPWTGLAVAAAWAGAALLAGWWSTRRRDA
ncbi:ABC transporter permease [Streptomyces coeruleoprunus]|uniref:ABC transporter permease n=1 Tax=Streptomyces coeruleoprunus TaxID=285563 RepID=A0ABV9XLJ8_9ACTN